MFSDPKQYAAGLTALTAAANYGGGRDAPHSPEARKTLELLFLSYREYLESRLGKTHAELFGGAGATTSAGPGTPPAPGT